MSNKWDLPSSPPPPMFLGEKERNFVKQTNDEISERVMGQTILYYPIDVAITNFHPLYGEAIEKNFLPPIRIFAFVEFKEDITTTENTVQDKMSKITVKFHKRRLTEDQDLFVREGDIIQFSNRLFEIVSLNDPRLLFGQQEHHFEIIAECLRARQGNISL